MSKSIFRICLLFLIIIKYVILYDCKLNEVKCPSGLCAASYQQCATFISCQAGLYKCNQFTCTNLNYKCIPNSCGNRISCWNGKCVDDLNDCPSIPTCPLNDDGLSVKCHDNSCVDNVENCPNYKDCPLFLPIKCTSGDCRKSLEDCPSLTRCPIQFPMLCNDGSCQISSENCIKASIQTQCGDINMVRCTGGTCATTKFLCPTPKTCPLGYVLCWDNTCASSYGKCKVPFPNQTDTCSNRDMIRCLDGSCRDNINSCPTLMICPTETPVRCWDNSCKETIEKCPTWQDCPEESISCNDGTCAIAKNKSSTPIDTSLCGTHITCPPTSPFKCFDNTCRKNPNDCPKVDICSSDSPILCWDGRCVKNRVDCFPTHRCDINTPVKCPDGTCHVSVEECKEIKGCPIGFLECWNGTCKRELKDCPKNECPLYMPVRCSNGVCTTSKDKCDNSETGCPFYAPYKCKNGICIKDDKNCPDVPDQEGKTVCPDGSIINQHLKCNLKNGCPKETPKLCANRLCVKEDVECPTPKCPSETPVKCFNGLCVKTKSSCTAIIDLIRNNFCEEELFPCADGTCAITPDQCKPIYPCPIGMISCGDGSCKNSDDYCPKTKTCPSIAPYRCKRGECVISENFCSNEWDCPIIYPTKCSNNGFCAFSISKCSDYDKDFNLNNGCDQLNKFKCILNGKCVSEDPKLKPNICYDEKCPDKRNPVFCYSNGKCAPDARSCIGLGSSCDSQLVRCPDQACKSDYMLCKSKNNCPLESPFRCIDGSCKAFPNLLIFNINSLHGLEQKTCPISLMCPSHKPFLCANGSCKEKRDFCLVVTPCPEDKPSRCADRLCYRTKNDCQLDICNPRNPILCPNGNCVNSIFDCEDNTCPNWLPIKCSDGNCVETPSKCHYKFLVQQMNNIGLSSPNCATGNAMCYDGSCRPHISMCPIFSGCKDSKFPYKCKDGSCKSSPECNTNSYLNNSISIGTFEPKCDSNEILCEDGMCREICPPFNACPNANPLMCPNGYCVSKLSQCAGTSAKCPLISPFRCIDGTCKANILDCPSAKRLNLFQDIVIFVYPGVDIYSELIFDKDNNILGWIYVPSNLLTSTGEITATPISVRPIPSSLLMNTTSKFNYTRKDDIYNEFSNADLSQTLRFQYEYAVLSPVVNITRMQMNKNYSSNIILSLAFDFPVYYEKKNKTESEDMFLFSPYKDVCMGKLNITSNEWKCLKLKKYVKEERQYILNSELKGDGIYAVIFYPKPNELFLEIDENFLIKYFYYISIFTFSLIILFTIGIYVFIRIYRYREKYKHTKQDEVKFNIQMKEINEMGTMNLHQNLGDIIDNMIYTKNPSFKVVKKEIRIGAREIEIENMVELLSRKLRILEGNNDRLKNNHNLLVDQIERQKLKDEQKTVVVKIEEKGAEKNNLNDEINNVSNNNTNRNLLQNEVNNDQL